MRFLGESMGPCSLSHTPWEPGPLTLSCMLRASSSCSMRLNTQSGFRTQWPPYGVLLWKSHPLPWSLPGGCPLDTGWSVPSRVSGDGPCLSGHSSPSSLLAQEDRGEGLTPCHQAAAHRCSVGTYSEASTRFLLLLSHI